MDRATKLLANSSSILQILDKVSATVRQAVATMQQKVKAVLKNLEVKMHLNIKQQMGGGEMVKKDYLVRDIKYYIDKNMDHINQLEAECA